MCAGKIHFRSEMGTDTVVVVSKIAAKNDKKNEISDRNTRAQLLRVGGTAQRDLGRRYSGMDMTVQRHILLCRWRHWLKTIVGIVTKTGTSKWSI